jgi:hypothetical protein
MIPAADRLLALFWTLMTRLGLCSEEELAIRAAALLHQRLFERPWAEGVSLQGLARAKRDDVPTNPAVVLVMTTGPVAPQIEAEAERLADVANARYGMQFRVRVVDWAAFRSFGQVRPLDAAPEIRIPVRERRMVRA